MFKLKYFVPQVSKCFWIVKMLNMFEHIGRQDMQNINNKKRAVSKLFWQAGQPDQLEYLFNNLRETILPTTKDNESLAEMNGSISPQRRHGCTLKLTFDILTNRSKRVSMAQWLALAMFWPNGLWLPQGLPTLAHPTTHSPSFGDFGRPFVLTCWGGNIV